MAHRFNTRSQDLRQWLAQEAARILAEEGVQDFLLAKRKAAERLGLPANGHSLPTNREIEAAVAEHHRLFHGITQPARLHVLRATAVQAMKLFAPFEPRLTGPVLSGTATRHAGVQLHLFTDSAEQVATHLLERDIPFESGDKRLRSVAGQLHQYPAFCFMAGDVEIEAVVFPFDAIREAPASPLDGKPMKRAALREVEVLLAEDEMDRPG